MSKPQTFDDAISVAQQIDLALGSGGVPLVHTGLASTTTDQSELKAELNEMKLSMDALRQEIRVKEGSSAAIGSQQSTLQATQLSPQISPQFAQSPQFNPQFDSYQHQAAPLPLNPYYPQCNYDGYKSFPENSSPIFNPSTQSYCTNCRKFGHDNTRCWGREPPRFPHNWRGAPNNHQWTPGPGRGQVPQNAYYNSGSVPVYNFVRRNPPRGRGTSFLVSSEECSGQTSDSPTPNSLNSIQLSNQIQPPVATTTEVSDSLDETAITSKLQQLNQKFAQDVHLLTVKDRAQQLTRTRNQYSDQNAAGCLIQCLPSLTRKESSDSLVNDASDSEQSKDPKPPHEKFPKERLKLPILPVEKQRMLIGGWTWTVNSSNGDDIPTSSSNTINSCVKTEPTDSLTEPVISNHSDPLTLQTMSCTTPSQRCIPLFPTEPKKLEKPVKSVEPKLPSLKPSKKSWFKSLANSLFKKIKPLKLKIFKTSKNDFDSSQIIETSDSEFELIPEKVTSFQKVEELDAPKVEESDVESCLPPPLYQNMKREIVTEFLEKHGSQKRKKRKNQKRPNTKYSQIQNSQQKQPCQNLPLNISDGAEDHVVESPTRISKNRVCSNVTGPVGRFKDSMGSDDGCKDEYNEFAKEMILSEIKSSNPSMKPLNKKSSLTLAERKNKSSEIAMKRNSKELSHMRKSEKLN